MRIPSSLKWLFLIFIILLIMSAETCIILLGRGMYVTDEIIDKEKMPFFFETLAYFCISSLLIWFLLSLFFKKFIVVKRKTLIMFTAIGINLFVYILILLNVL